MSNRKSVTQASAGHGYKQKSRYPLTAAMTEGKPVTQHVEGASSEKPTGIPRTSTDDASSQGHPKKDIGDALGPNGSNKVHLNSNTNAKLANPLGDLTDEEVMENAAAFAAANHLPVEAFRKGALVAKRPNGFEQMSILTEKDKAKLRREITHPYSQTKTLYNLVIACSVAAAVQGMDESVISGAQLFYPQQFGIGATNPDPKYANNHE